MTGYRVGIIGCGRRDGTRGAGLGIAQAHARAYKVSGVTEIAAAADINPENLQLYCDEHNVPGRYGDYRTMLAREHLDIVSICTWPQLHAEMVIAACRAQVRGVLCEKPMALTLSECDAMLEAARASGTKLAVDHQRRLGEPFRLAKEVAYGGDIGDLIRVETYIGPGSLLGWGTHWLDVMLFYVNDTPAEWVAAQVDTRRGLDPAGGHEPSKLDRSPDRRTIVHIQYKNGVRGYLETGMPSWGTVAHRLLGTEGFVEVLTPDPQQPDRPTVRARVKGRGEWLFLPTTLSINASGYWNLAVRDLVRAIEDGTEPELAGSRARATMEIIIGAYVSALRGGWIDLPLAPLDYSPFERLVEREGQ